MTKKKTTEKIVAFGHKNVQATHPTTLMITKHDDLTKNGDCVIAVGADKSLADLSEEFKTLLRKTNSKLLIKIKAGGLEELVNAEGNPNLSLSDTVDAVIRKSDFLSNRTLALKADKASIDLSRQMVKLLKNPKQKVIITLTVKISP